MSYTTINGMRSARYPLQGCIGCGPVGYYGVGQETAAAAAGGTALVGLIVLGTLGALLWGAKPPKSYERRMRSNRQRRRRRTSRRR